MQTPESATLRVFTLDPQPPANLVEVEPCTGGYTCTCTTHTQERALRIRNGIPRAHRPWEPQPARQRQAA